MHESETFDSKKVKFRHVKSRLFDKEMDVPFEVLRNGGTFTPVDAAKFATRNRAPGASHLSYKRHLRDFSDQFIVESGRKYSSKLKDPEKEIDRMLENVYE